MLLALAACEATGGSSPQPQSPIVAVTKPSVAPMPTAQDAKTLAAGSNQLGFELWAQVRTQSGNLALSPTSISTALAMAAAGARGNTLTQMQQVLHIDADAPAAWGKLAAGLQSPDRKLTLRIANRLFGEASFGFDKAYVEQTRTMFGAPLEPLDFKGNPEAARVHINAWVEAQTEHRIKDLLPGGTIKPVTRLVIVNAIYFLADWLEPFEKERTFDEPFFTGKDNSKRVPTMHTTTDLRYAKLAGVSMVALPYQGGDASMLIVVPDAVDGLAQVEQGLTADTFATWRSALAQQRVFVSLPKFTIDPAEPIELAEKLAALGMTDAFMRGLADFTGIANPASPEERLVISKVIHKAFVKVDEEGTEAAAATAVMAEGAGAMQVEYKEFKADRPFLFFIIDEPRDLVLFMGRVASI